MKNNVTVLKCHTAQIFIAQIFIMQIFLNYHQMSDSKCCKDYKHDQKYNVNSAEIITKHNKDDIQTSQTIRQKRSTGAVIKFSTLKNCNIIDFKQTESLAEKLCNNLFNIIIS